MYVMTKSLSVVHCPPEFESQTDIVSDGSWFS